MTLMSYIVWERPPENCHDTNPGNKNFVKTLFLLSKYMVGILENLESFGTTWKKNKEQTNKLGYSVFSELYLVSKFTNALEF